MIAKKAKSALMIGLGSVVRMRTLFAVRVALTVICLPTPSHALGTPEERAACTPDVVRLCGSEIPHVGRVIACVKAKRSELSPACKVVVDRHLGISNAASAQPAQ